MCTSDDILVKCFHAELNISFGSKVYLVYLKGRYLSIHVKNEEEKNFVLAFLQQNCSVLWFFWLRLRTEDQSLRTEDGPTPTENTLAEFLVLINSVGLRQPLASLPCHRLWHPFNVWLRNNLSIFHQYFPVFKPWYSTICYGLAQFASKAMDILSYSYI